MVQDKTEDMSKTIVEEPLLPRLLATNTLRSNLEKHMTLNQMADQKALMIMTAASLVMTISLTQFATLGMTTSMWLIIPGILAVICSILAIIPPLHAKGKVNLFYFRSFEHLSEEEFTDSFKACLNDREALYDAYLHEIYYLGKHRLSRKYALIRNGLWLLLIGFCGATVSALLNQLT